MKPKMFLIASIVCLLATSTSALATSFDSSLEPSTIDVGTVLVNFTVNETGDGIAQVNFALPEGFLYYGGGYGSSSSGSFSPTPMPNWYNTTTTLIVANGGDEKFWFKVTTPSTGAFPRSFNFNVSTTDVNGVFTFMNVSVTVDDQSPPKWSANFTTPSTPSKYVLNKNYTFNVTWIDNVLTDRVIFEWDETTNYTNTTTPAVQSLGSNKYSITLVDLSQGNYTYKWYSDDSIYGRENSTELIVFNVTRGDNPINLYLNGNLNQDLTINYEQTINVTATGGAVNLSKNDTRIDNPYDEILPIDTYVFKANSSGDYNYTANATGTTHYLNVIYPPPRYSISTTIPSTWSRNSYAYFYITWTDENDPNGFSTALIQLNHTGTDTNYTMNRTAGTNISTYSLNLTNPMVLRWRVYANNSNNEWNATPLTNTTIAKITPTISLTASPSWDVVTGTQTIVSCSSNQVSINLYRDGVLVSSPDIQTLGTGDYVYVCNNTPSVNYSSVSTSKMLDVLRYSADVSFIEAATLVSIEQGSSNSTTVIVENIGNASHVVSFAIENITSTWYTLNATEVSLSPGGKASFLVNFSIESSTEVKDYTGQYKATTVDRTVTSDFILRVLPKEELQSSISSDLAVYRVNMTNIWAEINNSKTEGLNVTVAEQKIIEAKEKIELAENYIDNGDYFNAYQLLDSIKTLIDAAGTELETALTPIGESAKKKAPLPKWMVWALAGAGILIGGVLIYLLWPQPGYDQKTGRYTHKTPKQHGAALLSETKEKIVSKMPKPKPKSVYKTSFRESSFKEQAAKISGIEVELPVSKRGRFTLQKTKTIQQKISENISKLKDRLKKKRKYEEVELKY